MPLALIAGAGIGGLAAGIALRRSGWDIRVFERADTPRAIGFALGLAPNAVAALRELGIADTVVAQGITPTAVEVRRVDGRVLRRFAGRLAERPGGDLPSVILRPVLHRALLDAVGPVAVELNHAAVGFRPDGRRVALELDNGTTATGDIVVGADGVGSIIRAQLHAEETAPQPSGYFAVRGQSPAIEKLGGLQALWYFGPGVESGVIQASPDAIYWFVSLHSEDVKTGPLDVASVMRRCTVDFDEQFHAITGATPPHDMRLDELFVRTPLDQWGAGAVTLLGDAAHPVLPHTGQGAAQALEDAVALGRVMRAGGDHLAALRRYERVRGRHTRRVINMAPWIAAITTTRNPVMGFLRNTAIRMVPERALVRVFTQTGQDPHRGL